MKKGLDRVSIVRDVRLREKSSTDPVMPRYAPHPRTFYLILSVFCVRCEGHSFRSSAGQWATTVSGTVLVCSSSCTAMNF